MIFLLKRVKPNIFCKVIDKDNIVSEIIKQMNNRDLYIKKKKNIISKGWDKTIEEVENVNLWLLLHWQALQLKGKGLGKSKLKLETMCLRLEDDGYPNLWCNWNKVVLTLKKAIKGEDLTDESTTHAHHF